ncbi:MAG: hypothetical protein CSA24_02050 [Deltaproteobacteria bacterium]|nr:MAG: hypothetical protein CSA24_02050 [Deltaproteobacteria bacterium]
MLNRLHLLVLTLAASGLLATAGCLGDGVPGGGGAAVASQPADTTASRPDATASLPDATASLPDGATIDPAQTPSDRAFVEQYAEVLTEAATYTRAQLEARYLGDAAPALTRLSYDPRAATHFELIDQTLALTPAEVAKLDDNGFVVSERLSYRSFGEQLLTVYETDLPILVTTDMILHALHSSYDDLLASLERQLLSDTLADVLDRAHEALTGLEPGGEAEALEAMRDADLFVTVARSLLTGAPVASATGGAVDAARDDFLARIDAQTMATVEIFGTRRKMDFSQFKPRGHYAGDAELERYFQAMMWLGRVDLRFVEQDPITFEWRFQGRQLAVAQLLDAAVRAGDALVGWSLANDLITLMVGPVDYIDLRGVSRLLDDHGIADASAAVTLSGDALAAVVSDLLSGKYGEQQINSHWLETDPFASEPQPLPASFAFLGQRFVVDSYVMANLVYDRIIHDGSKVQRVLPNPLDVLFVLGNDQVLPLLQGDLDRHPYQGALHGLRWLVDWYAPEFWQSNIYNSWLSALRALNRPTRGDEYPESMRTDAWRDRVAQTQLGSWAQLRHDTLLYAKQSYTGGVSCEHPDGYVEPYPAFYEALQNLAATAKQTLVNVRFEQAWMQQALERFFTNWEEIMAMLASMATKELDGTPLSDEEIAFIKNTIMADGGCGGPTYTGWYSTLYWNGERIGEWKPTIADVHTNPNSGPLPGPNVLHVATGNVNAMVFTADTCNGPRAYVGPVFSYYEVDPHAIERYTDGQWEAMLSQAAQPERPAWTQSFLVPAP